MQFLHRMGFFILTNIAVLALFSIIMMVLGMIFPDLKNLGGGYGYYLVYAAIFGFLGSFFSLFISKWMAKKAYGIEILTAETASQNSKLKLVWDVTERIARENNIKMPEVGYYESAEPNAFATGPSKNSSLVAVSTGLLNAMDHDAIEGVVGHEMAHILNGDMVTMTLIQGVMNTFVIFLSRVVADIIDNFFSSDDGEGLGWIGYNLVYMLLQVIFGFLAGFVINYYSRQREYRADAGGAKYTSKKKMIAGLKRLQELTKLQADESVKRDPKMAPFMIAEPEKDSAFSTHPSLDNRIKALESNYSLA